MNVRISMEVSKNGMMDTAWKRGRILSMGCGFPSSKSAYKQRAIPQNYWINTSSNAEVKEFIGQSKNLTTKREIERLMAGESITKTIHPELTYKEMYESIENIWSVLFATGYLTQSGQVDARKFKLRIQIGNSGYFKTQIMEYFKESVAKDGDNAWQIL